MPSSTVSVISTASSSSRPPSPDTTKRQRRDSGWGGELGAANSPPALPAAAAAVPAAVPVAVPPVVCVPLLAAPPLETNTRVPPQGYAGHAGTTTATPAWGTAQPGHSQPKSGGEGRQAWTSEEDRKIFDHVLANGAQWSRIAEKLPDRTDDAVRARYKRLKASGETAKRGDMWSPEEDAIISNLLGAR